MITSELSRQPEGRPTDRIPDDYPTSQAVAEGFINATALSAIYA